MKNIRNGEVKVKFIREAGKMIAEAIKMRDIKNENVEQLNVFD